MAKARSRTAARKVKDRWRSKNWYNIQAPASFDNVTVAETLSDDPNKLIDRVTEVSLQDLTNDFRKSHIKLFFKINNIEGSNAQTHYVGHTLTSDYLRRLIRRRRSKIDSVVDVSTRDGASIRVKPFATTDKRIQNSQRHLIRETMNKTISKIAKTTTLSEFVGKIVDGTIGRDIYKDCKILYPVKRVEIFKTELISKPTIKIEEKPKKKPEEPKEETTEETKDEKEISEEKTKKDKDTKETEEVTEDKPEDKEIEDKEEKPKKKKAKKTKTTKKKTKKTEDKPEEPKEETTEETKDEKEISEEKTKKDKDAKETEDKPEEEEEKKE